MLLDKNKSTSLATFVALRKMSLPKSLDSTIDELTAHIREHRSRYEAFAVGVNFHSKDRKGRAAEF